MPDHTRSISFSFMFPHQVLNLSARRIFRGATRDPETNSSHLKNGGLGYDYSLLGMAHFQGRAVSFREGNVWCFYFKGLYDYGWSKSILVHYCTTKLLWCNEIEMTGGNSLMARMRRPMSINQKYSCWLECSKTTCGTKSILQWLDTCLPAMVLIPWRLINTVHVSQWFFYQISVFHGKSWTARRWHIPSDTIQEVIWIALWLSRFGPQFGPLFVSTGIRRRSKGLETDVKMQKWFSNSRISLLSIWSSTWIFAWQNVAQVATLYYSIRRSCWIYKYIHIERDMWEFGCTCHACESVWAFGSGSRLVLGGAVSLGDTNCWNGCPTKPTSKMAIFF